MLERSWIIRIAEKYRFFMILHDFSLMYRLPFFWKATTKVTREQNEAMTDSSALVFCLLPLRIVKDVSVRKPRSSSDLMGVPVAWSLSNPWVLCSRNGVKHLTKVEAPSEAEALWPQRRMRQPYIVEMVKESHSVCIILLFWGKDPFVSFKMSTL